MITLILDHSVPPNVQFIIDDVEDTWVYHEGFDFIHSRGMGQAIRDWPKLLKQAYKLRNILERFRNRSIADSWLTRHLNPGGVLQLCETEVSVNSDDSSIPQDSALWEFQERYHEALARIGLPDPCRYLAQYMRAAGFVDVMVSAASNPDYLHQGIYGQKS